MCETRLGWLNSILLVVAATTFACGRGNAQEQAGNPPSGKADALATQELDRVLPEISFEDFPCEAVFDWFGRFLGIKVSVDWKDVSFSRDTPVWLHSKNCAARTALKLLLDNLSDTKQPSSFEERDGNIVIASAKKLAGPIIAREYDLKPLLSSFSQRGQSVQTEEIAALIQYTVRRGSWAGQGGAGGLALGDRKVRITQSKRAHHEIESLLIQLNHPQAPNGPEHARNARTHEALQMRIPEVAMEAIIENVLDFLREFTGLNLSTNWRALKTTGVDPDALVDVSRRDLTADLMLHIVLKNMNGKKRIVDYDLVDGVIRISTADAIARDFSLRVYNVAELLKKPGMHGPGALKYVKERAAKTSWRDNGGRADAWMVGDRLVVRQSFRGHQAVRRLLSELAATGTSRPAQRNP
jgi:hypothetical protein